MSYNMKHSSRSPLSRIGRRIAEIVAECNYAQNRLASLRDTPERF